MYHAKLIGKDNTEHPILEDEVFIGRQLIGINDITCSRKQGFLPLETNLFGRRETHNPLNLKTK